MKNWHGNGREKRDLNGFISQKEEIEEGSVQKKRMKFDKYINMKT